MSEPILVLLVSGALVVAFAIAAALLARGKAPQVHLDQLEKKVGELETGQQALAERVSHLPTRETVHHLANELTKMQGAVTMVTRAVEAVDRRTERMEDHFLKAEARGPVRPRREGA